MNMKIKEYATRLFIIAFLMFLFIGVILDRTDFGHNITGNIDWLHEKAELKNSDVSKITFDTGGSNDKEVELINGEKDDFVKKLIASKFYRSDWRGMVGTGSTVLIIFKGGKKETLEYCGNGVFQMTYKERMFSIRNKKLEHILLKYDMKL